MEQHNAKFEDLVGKVLVGVEYDMAADTLTFSCSDRTVYVMRHDQDCCETVRLIDGLADLRQMVSRTGDTRWALQSAEVVTSRTDTPLDDKYGPPESYTWTYYKLANIGQRATLRWFGESNGYYSEDVSFYRVTPE